MIRFSIRITITFRFGLILLNVVEFPYFTRCYASSSDNSLH